MNSRKVLVKVCSVLFCNLCHSSIRSSRCLVDLMWCLPVSEAFRDIPALPIQNFQLSLVFSSVTINKPWIFVILVKATYTNFLGFLRSYSKTTASKVPPCDFWIVIAKAEIGGKCFYFVVIALLLLNGMDDVWGVIDMASLSRLKWALKFLDFVARFLPHDFGNFIQILIMSR